MDAATPTSQTLFTTIVDADGGPALDARTGRILEVEVLPSGTLRIANSGVAVHIPPRAAVWLRDTVAAAVGDQDTPRDG